MDEEIVALLIPIIGILAGFGSAIAAFYFNSKQREFYHKERIAAIEKGMDIPMPPDITKTIKPPETYLRRGLQLSLLGLALCIALYYSSWHGISWVWGIPILAIGLANLIYYAVAKPKTSNTQENKSNTLQ
jgi:hypothetical protein